MASVQDSQVCCFTRWARDEISRRAVMATYAQIQAFVKQRYDFQPKTCWIAHIKSKCGLPVRQAHNRRDPRHREVPCPQKREQAIRAALQHFGMI